MALINKLLGLQPKLPLAPPARFPQPVVEEGGSGLEAFTKIWSGMYLLMSSTSRLRSGSIPGSMARRRSRPRRPLKQRWLPLSCWRPN